MSRKIPTFNLLIERYRQQLERMATGIDGTAAVAPQARAMLLLSHGLAWKQVAQATGLNTCRVEHFRRRFVCLGPPGLNDAPPLKRTMTRRDVPAMQSKRAA
ncbi:MAG: helix-turn-helix domain-containing protein [Roseimicrobium sp.]